MTFINYNDIIEKLVKCAYANRKVDTWEDIIAVINEIPTVGMDYIGTEEILLHNGKKKFRRLYEVIE